MKLDPNSIPEKNDKQLRTLRNSLNNRISALESGKETALKASHPLAGLDHGECLKIRDVILKELKSRKS